MGRPHRGRWIGHRPDSTFFKLAGIPIKRLKTTMIELDELEAMRLVDGDAPLNLHESAQPPSGGGRRGRHGHRGGAN